MRRLRRYITDNTHACLRICSVLICVESVEHDPYVMKIYTLEHDLDVFYSFSCKCVQNNMHSQFKFGHAVCATRERDPFMWVNVGKIEEMSYKNGYVSWHGRRAYDVRSYINSAYKK